jgi:cellobiose phosphorylase
MGMAYGYFDDANREYVITNPRTPVKWINYIGTLAFGGFVDQTGGALICRQDPALNRITRYITIQPASDFRGETLYVRLKQGDGYRVFSPFFVPTLDAYDRYECHVGLGYTRIISEFYGLRTEVTIFVPTGETCEIRDIRVTNVSAVPLDVDAIPVVEYTHFDALKQLTNADWVPQTMQSAMVPADGGRKILTQSAFMLKDTQVNYFTSSWPVSSFETDRAEFLGDNEYGTWARPLALQSPELSNYEARRGDNIGALLHHLGVLQPGETQRLVIQLGQAASIESARPAIHRYWQAEAADQALVDLHRTWDGYLSAMHVETPDADLNRMLNIHNLRQCLVTKNWSRYLSFYQLGYGARGIGFRDSSQDVLAVLAVVPDEGRELIEKLLSVQRGDGSAMHQFNPLSLEGSMGDAMERDDRPHYYSDDPLWAILAVTAYVKETGDLSFLDKVIPFYEKDKRGQPLEAGTVLEHLHRCLEFTRTHVGAHGLPLLGFADWNDTINLPTGAESLFTANLYGKALLEMVALAEYRHDPVTAGKFAADYAVMKARFNACAWDGAWYVRYFDADGSPIGSHVNPQGQIHLNGQSWPVISGFAAPEQGRLALEAVYRRLNTRHGIKLSTPGYNGFDPKKGGVTTYPPGAKENGGIFLHPNPWVMIAECLMGNNDRAYEYYRQINPAAKNDVIDEFQCEPYVYPQNILGDEHPQFGLARNSWLSGTASWMYQAGTQWILGIRPTYAGLQVAPRIPAAWPGFSASRLFRGVNYQISVKRSGPGNTVALTVDGRAVEGDVVPPAPSGTAEVRVEVRLS